MYRPSTVAKSNAAQLQASGRSYSVCCFVLFCFALFLFLFLGGFLKEGECMGYAYHSSHSMTLPYQAYYFFLKPPQIDPSGSTILYDRIFYLVALWLLTYRRPR